MRSIVYVVLLVAVSMYHESPVVDPVHSERENNRLDSQGVEAPLRIMANENTELFSEAAPVSEAITEDVASYEVTMSPLTVPEPKQRTCCLYYGVCQAFSGGCPIGSTPTECPCVGSD